LLIHGMHEQGIDEPRLARFARALASTGLLVGTPELADLRHFGVSWGDVVQISEAARALARRIGEPSVQVFGVSFGGGLALRAACDARWRRGIERVIALGAPDDLVRVSRYALGQSIRDPAGQPVRIAPHAYARRAALKFLLGPAALPPPGPGRDELLEQLLALRAPALHALSPSACRTQIEVPVFLAHGLGDTVIPYSETQWLARDLPLRAPAEVLISPAIAHAEYAPPSLRQRLQLVEFMAKAAAR
jgi:pimeloyl-ACP methyl ester carboxylesterase